MKCHYHPGLEAIAVCARCGRAVCQYCSVNVGGKLYCRGCSAVSNVPAWPASVTKPINTTAIVSMVLGIVGWLFEFLVFCILSLVTVGTWGLGLICVAPMGLMPYLGWVPAIITGHKALRRIKRYGEGGRGMALIGLISGYSGVGLRLLLCLLVVILLAAGVSIPYIDKITQR